MHNYNQLTLFYLNTVDIKSKTKIKPQNILSWRMFKYTSPISNNFMVTILGHESWVCILQGGGWTAHMTQSSPTLPPRAQADTCVSLRGLPPIAFAV